jgi:hypothetical protein
MSKEMWIALPPRFGQCAKVWPIQTHLGLSVESVASLSSKRFGAPPAYHACVSFPGLFSFPCQDVLDVSKERYPEIPAKIELRVYFFLVFEYLIRTSLELSNRSFACLQKMCGLWKMQATYQPNVRERSGHVGS